MHSLVGFFVRFQSTLPARGATAHALGILRAAEISIHAPRTGSDDLRAKFVAQNEKFQSTLPARGATSAYSPIFASVVSFQSTLPARGATVNLFQHQRNLVISIHAPRTGSDLLHRLLCHPHTHFNPRSPHGERPLLDFCCFFVANISIHAPRTGSDAAHENVPP